MTWSVSLSIFGVGVLVMLSLSLEFFVEELPVWSHVYALMAGIGIGIALLGAFAAPTEVRVIYA